MFPRNHVRTIRRNGYRPRREGCQVARQFAGYTPYTVADRKAHYDREREGAAWSRQPNERRRLRAADNEYHFRWGMFAVCCWWRAQETGYRAGACGERRATLCSTQDTLF